MSSVIGSQALVSLPPEELVSEGPVSSLPTLELPALELPVSELLSEIVTSLASVSSVLLLSLALLVPTVVLIDASLVGDVVESSSPHAANSESVRVRR